MKKKAELASEEASAITDLERIKIETDSNSQLLCELIISTNNAVCSTTSADKSLSEANVKQVKENTKKILDNNELLKNALISIKSTPNLSFSNLPFESKKSAVETGDQTKPELSLQTAVGNYFTEKLNIIEKKKEKLEEKVTADRDKLQRYSENIYKLFKEDNTFALYVDGKNQSVQEGKFTLLEPVLNWRDVFLSKDSTFSVVYQLVFLTFTAILVFGLIYLILIFISRIFFMSFFAGSLSEQGKNFLQGKESAAPAEGFSRVLVASLAATGIGVAAIIATPPTNPFGKNDRSFYDTKSPVFLAADSESDRGKFKNSRPQNVKLTADDIKLDLPEEALSKLTELTESISNLNTRLGDLELALKKNEPENGRLELDENTKKFLRDITGESAQISGSLSTLQQAVGTKGATDSGTVIKSLNDISEKLPTAVKVEVSPTPDLSGIITAIDNIVKPLEPLSKISDKVVLQTTQVSGINDNTREIAKTAKALDETSSALLTNELGKNGRNLNTKLKNLFLGERYLVTSSSYDILEKIIPDGNDNAKLIRQRLKQLSDNRSGGLLSREKMLDALNCAPRPITREFKEELGKWQRLILRITRVGR